MADISLKRAHQLGLKGARAAADRMIDKLEKQFGLSGDWQGNTLHFDRPGVSGRLTVSDSDMQLEVTLGFLLKAMKGPIERAVHEQLDTVLTEAKAAASPGSPAGARTAARPATRKK
ncbi:MAG TPA: polyhydroxyalkanoic acid system family protein [Usitatibacteraceae bacterium]